MSAVLPPEAVAGTGARSETRVAVARPADEPRSPSAAERLDASRRRLRAALMKIAHPPAKPSVLEGLGGFGVFANDLIARVRSLPAAAIVIETLEHWWADHPLHTAGLVAEEASRQFVGPIARKNPFALVLGAVVVGALFALSRPWRWLFRPALFVGLLPQLASRAMKRMPIESLMEMLASFTAKRSRGTKPAANTEAADAMASGLPKGS